MLIIGINFTLFLIVNEVYDAYINFDENLFVSVYDELIVPPNRFFSVSVFVFVVVPGEADVPKSNLTDFVTLEDQSCAFSP
ncbi:hypothetical protein D3C80_1521470 [compost metagenome]